MKIITLNFEDGSRTRIPAYQFEREFVWAESKDGKLRFSRNGGELVPFKSLEFTEYKS